METVRDTAGSSHYIPGCGQLDPATRARDVERVFLVKMEKRIVVRSLTSASVGNTRTDFRLAKSLVCS